MARKRYAFAVYRAVPDYSAEVELLEIRVLKPKTWNPDDWEELCALNFQRNTRREERVHEWYGGRLTVEAESADRLREAAGLFRRIFGESQATYLRPEVVENLKALGPQVVYDPRPSHWVAIDEVLGPEYHLWLAKGSDGAVLAKAMATDPDEARDLLTREIAGRIAKRAPSDDERYVEWLMHREVADAQTLFPSSIHSPPKIHRLEDLLPPPSGEAVDSSDAGQVQIA